MKLGIVCRADDRGLGMLGWAAYRNLQPERALVIDMGTIARGFVQHFDRYPGERIVTFDGHELPELEVRAWLAGLDVVLMYETAYDWRMIRWADDMGVATIVMVMPEFHKHGNEPLPFPTQFWAPTTWRLDLLPPGTPVVPVPVEDDVFPLTPAGTGDRLQVVHVAGHRAAGDRNGTLQLLTAAQMVRQPMDIRVLCQDERLPQVRLRTPGVTLKMEPGGVKDRRDLYAGSQLMVLPRRYGGLCLARGSLVRMGDGTRRPIEDVQPGEWVRDDSGSTLVTGRSERTVSEHVVVTARGLRLESSVDHLHMVAESPVLPLHEVKASEVAPGDWILVVRPDPHGITSVEMGPKPVRKALRLWWETVTMDEGWARLIGLWLAEGHRGMYSRPGRDRPQAVICWSFGEQRFAEETVALLAERGIHATWKYHTTEGSYGPGGVYLVRCRTLWLYELFDRLGLEHGAFHKRAPDLDSSLVPALIGGWLDGDGCVSHGCISGFSRSTAMIRDFWRLYAKVGILASINSQGQKLDVGDREQTIEVGTWGTRMENTREYERTGRRSAYWRTHESGWLVRVGSVERVGEPLDVVALETASGRYIAEDLLTHNCLPAQEALASGLALAMPSCPPNLSTWPVAPLRGRWEGRQATPSGEVKSFSSDARYIAATLDRLARNPVQVAELQTKAIDWAKANAWSELAPLYHRMLAEACR